MFILETILNAAGLAEFARRQLLSPSGVALGVVVTAAALLAVLCSRPRAAGIIGRYAGKVFWARRTRYFLAAGVFICTAYLSWGPFYWRHLVADESGYLLQAKMYAAGIPYSPMLEEYHKIDWAEMVQGNEGKKAIEWKGRNRNFFLSPYEGVIGGKRVVFYSPTYPLLLAAGIKAGVPWLPNALFAGASVLLAAYAAERIYGARAGAAAAWFFAASPALTLKGGSYYSETAFIFFYLIFMILFFKVLGRKGLWFSFGLGAIWGIMFTVREYSTFAGTLPFLAVWFVSAFRERRPEKLCFVPGVLVGIAPEFAYNWYITANPFFFPRFTCPLSQLSLSWTTVFEFSIKRLWYINSDALGWPIFSLAPVIAALIVIRNKSSADKIFLWSLPVTFIVFIPVNALGIDYGSRYLITAVVAAVFLTARLTAFLWRRFSGDGGHVGRPGRLAFLNGCLLILAIFAFFNTVVGARREITGEKFETIHDALWETPALRQALRSLDVHNAVVFVGPPPHGVGPMVNGPKLDDDIIFARDQGERNTELMAAFPGRRFLRCDYLAFKKKGLLFDITPERE